MLKPKTIDRILGVLAAILVVLFVQVVREANGAALTGELPAKSVPRTSQVAQNGETTYRTNERQDVEPIPRQRRARKSTVVDLQGGGI